MNLKEQKELAELEVVRQDLSSKLGEKIQSRIDRLASQCLDDFDKFFRSQGFVITKQHWQIQAEYKNFSITLSHEDPKQAFFATYLPFTLKICPVVGSKTEHQVFLVDERPSAAFSFADNNTVNGMRNSIQNLLDKLNTFDDTQWVFELRQAQKPKTLVVGKSKQIFPTMTAVLQFLFEQDV